MQTGSSFYSLLMYTVNVLEPAALCSVYGARDSKKTDVGGNGNALYMILYNNNNGNCYSAGIRHVAVLVALLHRCHRQTLIQLHAKTTINVNKATFLI